MERLQRGRASSGFNPVWCVVCAHGELLSPRGDAASPPFISDPPQHNLRPQKAHKPDRSPTKPSRDRNRERTVWNAAKATGRTHNNRLYSIHRSIEILRKLVKYPDWQHWQHIWCATIKCIHINAFVYVEMKEKIINLNVQKSIIWN